MTTDQPTAPADLNAEALEVLRTLVTDANTLPDVWRETILTLVRDGIPRDLAPLETLIATTRGNG
jgi:hypothetical protein